MKQLIFFLVIISLFFSGCVSSQTITPRVCFGEKCVLVEIADDSEERSRGLMYRQSVVGNNGMLFVFDSLNVHGFWMKNTLIPLDGIWLDAQGNVVDVIRMIPCENDPCPVYTPRAKALYVLEVNAGTAENWNIVPGAVAKIYGV